MTTNTLDKDKLRDYYGKIIQGSKDLQTSVCCCTDENLTPSVRRALTEINDEILTRFYGCGSPLPPALAGCTMLDLGCGSGRDAFLAAKLVGPSGYVIGVDMTEEQLEVARRNIDTQMIRFGFAKPNIDFRNGYIEDLKALDIADNSVDVVISNCVINLSPDKRSVFSEIFRVLKPGGELLFADVFAGRRVPEQFYLDPVLHGECLAGAMYREDFRRLLRDLGCLDFRKTASCMIDLGNPEIEAKIGMVDFYSETIRAFKLDSLEDICEDYGQTATYHGTVADFPHFFDLDDHHRFITGKPMLVCGNTASMLAETRYAPHFTVIGDRSSHFGPFICGSGSEKAADDDGCGGACC
ncbi:MAG: methyltransferase domain-containing protein [Proteobacteria bacterium]|nr:methyltransferase domain-containing protein [Pseudomonadota bacterium]MBU1738571.1 methyltransferase domain-containing protein [Pseudomonadota bacterium]